MNSNYPKSESQVADAWIAELVELGYSYDDMLPIFKLAKQKYKLLKKNTNAN